MTVEIHLTLPVLTQDEDDYGSAALTLSLGIVNLAIFVLFCYLCYSAWRDLVVEDETSRCRDRLTALLQSANLPQALLELVVSKTVHTKTFDQEEELKVLLAKAEGGNLASETEHAAGPCEEPRSDPGTEMAVFGELTTGGIGVASFEITTHGDIEEGTSTNHFPAETDEGTGTTSPSAAGASNARFTKKDKAEVLEIFTRCDLDASGTLNSNEEAEQLLTFAMYKLQDVIGRGVTPEVLESKTKKLIDTDLKSNPMDFETFWEWFVENFDEKDA